MAANPFEHVLDSHEIHTFESAPKLSIHLPAAHDLPTWLQPIFPHGITKFMVLELMAAVLVFLFVYPVAKRLRTGEPPRGWWANSVEALLLFLRDQVIRPSIGGGGHETPEEHEKR